jgi:hypothetical protein
LFAFLAAASALICQIKADAAVKKARQTNQWANSVLFSYANNPQYANLAKTFHGDC